MAVQDPWAEKAVAFLVQALGVEADVADLAADVVALKREPDAGVSAIELESPGLVAAFLVFHYLLPESGDAGHSQFRADLRELERSNELGGPGPRVLAHGTSGREAYILATTPEVARALSGQPLDEAEPVTLVAPPLEKLLTTRREAAGNLMLFLQRAEVEADRWLTALRSSGYQPGETAATGLTAEESALALHILEKGSTTSLFELMSTLAAVAEDETRQSLKRPAD